MLSALPLWATLAGCLHLGTSVTGDSPETIKRISSLETRVGVLEQAVLGHAAQPASPSDFSQTSASDSPAWPPAP
jgi:hypothetical protein